MWCAEVKLKCKCSYQVPYVARNCSRHPYKCLLVFFPKHSCDCLPICLIFLTHFPEGFGGLLLKFIHMKLRYWFLLFITDSDISMQSSRPEECYQEIQAWITIEQFLLLSEERNAKRGAWWCHIISMGFPKYVCLFCIFCIMLGSCFRFPHSCLTVL